MNAQSELWPDEGPDFRFKGAGHRRTHVGNVVEEVVCAVMGWTRLAIDPTPGGVSPDASDAKGRPVEIKSVAVSATMNGKSVVYDWRILKEKAKCPGLVYAFVCRESKGDGPPFDHGEIPRQDGNRAARGPAGALGGGSLRRADAAEERGTENTEQGQPGIHPAGIRRRIQERAGSSFP